MRDIQRQGAKRDTLNIRIKVRGTRVDRPRCGSGITTRHRNSISGEASLDEWRFANLDDRTLDFLVKYVHDVR